MDLIEATGEMNSQPRPVRSRLDALEEALRKSELEETRRRGIQPRVRQAEVGGYSVTGLDQGSGKRPGGRGAEPPRAARRCRRRQSAERRGRELRRSSTDRDKLDVRVLCGQLLAERGQNSFCMRRGRELHWDDV